MDATAQFHGPWMWVYELRLVPVADISVLVSNPTAMNPAPSQASQGRFCSTKIIWGVCGRQVALSLVRKPKDVKNSMHVATLISVHRAPKVQRMLLHFELTLNRLPSFSFTGNWWESDAKRNWICAGKYWANLLILVYPCVSFRKLPFPCWTGK